MTDQPGMDRDQMQDIRQAPSVLGDQWVGIYSIETDTTGSQFREAMMNIIKQPNVNSTVIMRADIIREPVKNAMVEYNLPLDSELCPLALNISDTKPREYDVPSDFLTRDCTIVRRIIPRNPQRDPVINQSCLIYRGTQDDSILVTYIPHLSTYDEVPYYLPPMKAVGILYDKNTISVHYIPFEDQPPLQSLDDSDRSIRIALRLLQTSAKHSRGVKVGYQKRVNHDVIVDKVAFQDKYVMLKQKYAKALVANWAESTDPKKHVFEDLSIAAFLMTLWEQMYDTKEEFQFADLGCGNGLLVHLLLQEGYQGFGIDARARKSWATYPEHVQACLKEQVFVPRILLDDDSPELNDPGVCTLEGMPPVNTFLIGNHSDELTVWLPLLGLPFMVIPCCSHALSGARYRYPPLRRDNSSTYGSLCDRVELVASQVGWKVEKERLRIPSTRNAAIIGRNMVAAPQYTVQQVLQMEGGADGWIENTLALRKKSPRGH